MPCARSLMGEDVCIGTRAGEDLEHGFEYATLGNGSMWGFNVISSKIARNIRLCWNYLTDDTRLYMR